jgi:hypothetical protein
MDMLGASLEECPHRNHRILSVHYHPYYILLEIGDHSEFVGFVPGNRLVLPNPSYELQYLQ